jgi:hypothetical protein
MDVVPLTSSLAVQSVEELPMDERMLCPPPPRCGCGEFLPYAANSISRRNNCFGESTLTGVVDIQTSGESSNI